MKTKDKLYGTIGFSQQQAVIFTALLSVLLIPAGLINGWSVLLVTLLSYVTMLAVELPFQYLRKKELGYTIYYLPLVYALLLPPTIPLWIVVVGAFFISFFGKGVFGGRDKYVIHPVVAGIIFITISFPAFLNTSWLDPISGDIVSATSVNLVNSGNIPGNLWNLLNGMNVGSYGETFRLGILVVGLAMMILKLIDYKIVVSYLLGVIFFTGVFALTDGNFSLHVLYTILVGNVLFVALFVATDPPTIPLYTKGRIYYGIGLALFTVLIRLYSAFPEGALFAVVIMNAVGPLFDQVKGVEHSE